MISKEFLKNLFLVQGLALFLFTQVGCQNNSSSGGNANPPPKADDKNKKPDGDDKGEKGGSGTTAPLNCEQLWQENVRNHSVGRFIENESSTFMVQEDGSKQLTSKSLIGDKVTFNDGSKIISVNTTDMKYPTASHHESEDVQTKEEFLANCGRIRQVEGDSKFDIENLADENIRVKAGQFLCSHHKMTSKPNAFEGIDQMITESWNAKDHPEVAVKSITHSMMNYNGEKFETLTLSELTKLKLN
jgi:hypothetical protein